MCFLTSQKATHSFHFAYCGVGKLNGQMINISVLHLDTNPWHTWLDEHATDCRLSLHLISRLEKLGGFLGNAVKLLRNHPVKSAFEVIWGEK